MEIAEKEKRQLIECALTAARKRQSQQTGFVHHCYETPSSDTIPVLENFCFALSLLRSRLSEHVLEAKTLLDKLLHFEVEGNFPVYLHEFPLCREKNFCIEILSILHLVMGFSSVFSDELCFRLKRCMKRLSKQGDLILKEGSLSKAYEAKLLSLQGDFDKVSLSPSSSNEWSELLFAAHLSSKKHLEEVLAKALSFWHSQLLVYTGPQKQLSQEKEQPALSLLDLWLCHALRKFSKRALDDHPLHLRASLIPTLEPVEISQDKAPHLMLFEKEAVCPFILYWGDEKHCHSLLLQKKCQIDAQIQDKKVQFLAHLADTAEEDCVDLSFFCNLAENTSLFVNGLKATTYQLGDLVEIRSEKLTAQLKFSLEEGEGVFFGQILRANRPSQLMAKGEMRFEVYDWKIALRTIRRSPNTRLKIDLEVIY